MIEPGYCRWPSERGCLQSVPTFEELCYYHLKVKAGLIESKDVLVKKTTHAADVVSDEQLANVALLTKLGASPKTIRQALAKKLPSPTKGTGVKRGRVALESKNGRF